MQWFIPFLAVILCIEVLSNILYLNIHDPSNPKWHYSTLWLSEICSLLSVGFFSFIYFHIHISKRQKKALQIITPIYLFSCLICWAVLGVSVIFMGSLVAGGILMVFFSALVFYHFLRADDIILTREMIAGLWIAAGVLIFYSGIEICIAAIPYIRSHSLKLFDQPLYNIIPRLLCAVLYPCLSISFYLWHPRQK